MTLAFVLVLAGLAAALAGADGWARAAWIAATAVVAGPLALRVARVMRRRELGVDVIALLAMIAAVAVGEVFAAAVVAVMVAGGLALEDFASTRAKRELSALLARSPRTAHRIERGEVRRIDAGDVRPGDLLVVPHGELVAVDGRCRQAAVLDESAVTGEATPADRAVGDTVRSGTVNAGPPFEMTASASAAESTYAAMVRLAREADARKAPFVRMADRYAGWFLAATLLASAGAWALSGDPARAVAVLVVATPCPLILAAPIALVSGISRAASRGVLVKGGPALEGLARARILLMDKTGTATVGAASVADVVAVHDLRTDEVLRLAASVEQMSSHVFAPAIVRAARARGLALAAPSDVVEEGGRGIRGTVEGRQVAIGKAGWIGGDIEALRGSVNAAGTSAAFVAVDGRLAGAVVLRDPIRPDAAATTRRLRRSGIDRIVLLTGDHRDVAQAVGTELGVDAVVAEASAVEKVAVVNAARRGGFTVMVGDGVNDAAALAQADVGVALGATGSAASVESADAVLLVDRLDRLAEAIEVAGRSMRIARQSVIVGMGLSIAAMGAAAVGWLPPVAGALLQEGIDVAVILNALRARSAGEERADEEGMDRGRDARARGRLAEPAGG